MVKTCTCGIDSSEEVDMPLGADIRWYGQPLVLWSTWMPFTIHQRMVIIVQTFWLVYVTTNMVEHARIQHDPAVLAVAIRIVD